MQERKDRRAQRNTDIRNRYFDLTRKEGLQPRIAVKKVADEFYLAESYIKKLIYENR